MGPVPDPVPVPVPDPDPVKAPDPEWKPTVFHYKKY